MQVKSLDFTSFNDNKANNINTTLQSNFKTKLQQVNFILGTMSSTDFWALIILFTDVEGM